MTDEVEFDWGELSEDEWRGLAREARASELHLRFAVCKDRGCSDVEAAAQAGYTGTRDVIKGSGHRAKKTRSVITLLALAERRKAELSITDPSAPNREERRRLLGKLAKSRDPRVQQQAIDALNRMEDADRAVQAAAYVDPDPRNTLAEIAKLSPLCAQLADELARIHKIDFSSKAALARPAESEEVAA
ncbi:hypothetical protein I6F36_05775 [Bradyrhizobium sp. BRP19]|uniref:hypothetical protein n=1 Tax=Bradyrhizobium sp. BRP19 TaxID=2793823 RepID=UPI001CD5E09B|nr:hypothetical protein [Bradyrhizobium sp. BRP19]MCA1546312.1 hypothetical protein [Bradyrhizobium sp. BRP19]